MKLIDIYGLIRLSLGFSNLFYNNKLSTQQQLLVLYCILAVGEHLANIVFGNLHAINPALVLYAFIIHLTLYPILKNINNKYIDLYLSPLDAYSRLPLFTNIPNYFELPIYDIYTLYLATLLINYGGVIVISTLNLLEKEYKVQTPLEIQIWGSNDRPTVKIFKHLELLLPFFNILYNTDILNENSIVIALTLLFFARSYCFIEVDKQIAEERVRTTASEVSKVSKKPSEKETKMATKKLK